MNLWAPKELKKQFKHRHISSVSEEIKTSRCNAGPILILFTLVATWKNNECICTSYTLQKWSIFCYSLLTCNTLNKFIKMTVSVWVLIAITCLKIPHSLTQNESLQKHYLSLDLHRLKQIFKKQTKNHPPNKTTTKPNQNPSISLLVK